LQLQPEAHLVVVAIPPRLDANSIVFWVSVSCRVQKGVACVEVKTLKEGCWLAFSKPIGRVPADDDPASIVGVEVVGGNPRPTGIQLPDPAHHEKVVAPAVATSP
jgi:hypothetical protein